MLVILLYKAARCARKCAGAFLTAIYRTTTLLLLQRWYTFIVTYTLLLSIAFLATFTTQITHVKIDIVLKLVRNHTHNTYWVVGY
jgi:hypothetical protein